MAHNREKKALYEVINKTTWSKPRDGKVVEPVHPEEAGKDEQIAPTFPAPGRTRWLSRPRMVQFNSGRIEISVPYQLAVALFLGLILLFLIAFRLGQITYRSSQKAADSTAKAPQSIQETAADMPQRFVAVKGEAPATLTARKVEPVAVKPKGDNRIVIQSYQLRADLEPVRRYFAQFGIETEIMKISDWYYLVTKDKYENPARPGTDGYIMRQQIVKLGAEYKAPPGYETFGSKPFSDAYGKKFDE